MYTERSLGTYVSTYACAHVWTSACARSMHSSVRVRACLCMSACACARERRRNATARPLDVCHHVCMCVCECMHVHVCVRVDSMQACASRHVRLCLEACTGALVRTRASAAPSAVVCSPYPRACAYVWIQPCMRVSMARHRRARIGIPV